MKRNKTKEKYISDGKKYMVNRNKYISDMIKLKEGGLVQKTGHICRLSMYILISLL
jgi:hypothetical protein